MSDARAVLEFLGARYAQARAGGDELRLRALELVIAACARPAAEAPVSAPPPAVPPPDEPLAVDAPLVPDPAQATDLVPDPVQPAGAGPDAEHAPAPDASEGASWWGPREDERG